MSPTHTTYEKEDFDDERFLLYLLTKERAVSEQQRCEDDDDKKRQTCLARHREATALGSTDVGIGHPSYSPLPRDPK